MLDTPSFELLKLPVGGSSIQAPMDVIFNPGPLLPMTIEVPTPLEYCSYCGWQFFLSAFKLLTGFRMQVLGGGPNPTNLRDRLKGGTSLHGLVIGP